MDFVCESDIEIGVGGIPPSITPPQLTTPVIQKGKRQSYGWLSKITTIHLNLCGSDLSQRIELSCSNGQHFKTDLRRKKEIDGTILPDQKQFTLLNNSDEKLITVDFTKDRKSFHIMEPDSDHFIAFFTVKTPIEGSRVEIHNVIDDEIYHTDCTDSPYRVLIKSEKGEEMGTISRPLPKWTQILSGSMTLNFTGDDREGLTTREKAILLGFLIALGIFGMDYWKRSSSGILTVYLLSILIFVALVIFIYCRYREGASLMMNSKSSNASRTRLPNTELSFTHGSG